MYRQMEIRLMYGGGVVIDCLHKIFDFVIVLPCMKVIFTSIYLSCSVVKLRYV